MEDNGKYMNKFEFYYPKLKKKQKKFENMLAKLDNCKDEMQKLSIAQGALSFAAYNGTGYFYSTQLEKFYTDLAEQYDISSCNVEYKSNSFLHVMTTCYNVSGHTRVVERWIGQADPSQMHSVVLLNQNVEDMPELLRTNVKEKNGDFIVFNIDDTQIEKALKLREIASHYEYIILHTHMDDPIATIAFGTKKFTRPVILYNHADHMFWIGKSIADIVADLKGVTSITKPKRLVNNPYFLGIPLDDKVKIVSKEEARKKLNIPLDKKIVLTIGGGSKYFPIGKYDLKNSFTEILNKNQNSILYCIGPKKDSVPWRNFDKSILERVHLIGCIDYEKDYQFYLCACDLIVDSYPMPGYTVAVDAVTHNVPFLSLDNTLGQLDFITKTSGYCKNELELKEKAFSILNADHYSKEIAKEEQDIFYKENSKDAFNLKLKQLLEITPKQHTVKNLQSEKEPCDIDDSSVLVDIMYKRPKNYKVSIDKTGVCTKRQGIPHILEMLTYVKSFGKLKKIKLFNIDIFTICKKK